MSLPLVSALTPTFNRRTFFPRAVECFLAQDYANLEWVIVDNGTDSIKNLLPNDPRIKYFLRPGAKLNHGQLMNICCELASGDFLCVEDDDDFYVSTRVSRLVRPMIDNPTIQLTGSSTLYYYQLGTQTAYQYSSPKGICWLSAIAFRKSLWAQHKFDPIINGADYNLQKKLPANAKFDLADPSLVCATIHSQNACRKHLGNDYRPVPWATIESIVGGNF